MIDNELFLTDKQKEVIDLFMAERDLTQIQIAERLNRSQASISQSLSQISVKLGYNLVWKYPRRKQLTSYKWKNDVGVVPY